MTYQPSNCRATRMTATGLPLHEKVIEYWDYTLADVSRLPELKGENWFYNNEVYLPPLDDVLEFIKSGRDDGTITAEQYQDFLTAKIWNVEEDLSVDEVERISVKDVFDLYSKNLPVAMRYRMQSHSVIRGDSILTQLAIGSYRDDKATAPVTLFDLGVFWDGLRARPDNHVSSSKLRVGQIATLFSDDEKGVPHATFIAHSNENVMKSLEAFAFLGDDDLTWAMYSKYVHDSLIGNVPKISDRFTIQDIIAFRGEGISLASVEGFVDNNLTLDEALPYFANDVKNLAYIRQCLDNGIDPVLAASTGYANTFG